MKRSVLVCTYLLYLSILFFAGCTSEIQTGKEKPVRTNRIRLNLQVANLAASHTAELPSRREEIDIQSVDLWFFEGEATDSDLPTLHRRFYKNALDQKDELYQDDDGFFYTYIDGLRKPEDMLEPVLRKYKIFMLANQQVEQAELWESPYTQSLGRLLSFSYKANERPSLSKDPAYEKRFCMTDYQEADFSIATNAYFSLERLPVKLAIQINDKHSSGITVTKLECLNDQQKVYMSAPEGSVDSAPFAESLNIPFKKKGADTLAVATTYINENLSSQPIELLIIGTLDGEEKKWRAAITPDGSPVLLRNTACNITLNLLANSVSTSITIRPWDAGTKQEVSMDELWITNCYIVPPGGQLFVPYTAALQARRMLWGDNMDAGQQITAEVIWADTRELADGVTVETKNELEVVDVNFPTGCQGNLVVGIKKAGESAYLWSWHLWVTDYDPWKESGRVVFEVEEGSENNFNKKRIWMDRNLGAMTNQYDEKGTARGLCYQWGRKDPFPGSTGWAENPQEPVLYTPGGGTTSVSVKNMNYQESFSDPLAFGDGFPMWCADLDSDIGNRTSHLGVLWSKDMIMKTLFDPCPYGWKSSNFSIPRASDFVYSNKGRQGEPYGYWSFTESRTIAGPQKAVAGNYWSTRVDYYISRLWVFDEAQAAPPAQRPPNHSDAHSMRCVISDIFF